VKDHAAGIDRVSWTVYGKIASVVKSDGTTIAYTYDVSGNRISKTVNGIVTWYVRDATGNVLSVYTINGDIRLTETHLYGSNVTVWVLI
jgi:YD repeat-containing protein